MNNYIWLALYSIIMVVYFILFKKKSLDFVLVLVWFILNIFIISSKIYFDSYIISISNAEVYNYVNSFSKFISILKDLRIIVFFGVIVSFYFHNRPNKKSIPHNK